MDPQGLVRTKSRSLDLEAELDRWRLQLEMIDSGVNDLFGEVQVLRNGRYIRTEQVYRK